MHGASASTSFQGQPPGMGADGVTSGLVLSYAGSDAEFSADVAWRMAWWVGLVWSVGIALSQGAVPLWALVDIAAGPRGLGEWFVALQQLLLGPSAGALAIVLVASRLRRVRKTWLVAATLLAGATFVAGPPAQVLASWYSGGWPAYPFRALSYTDFSILLGTIFREANRSMWLAGQWAGLLILLWALLSPSTSTPRRIVYVAGLILLLEPASHAIMLTQLFSDPLPRSPFYYLLLPSSLFQHANALIHLAGALLIFRAVRAQPPTVLFLRLAALAIPAAVLLTDVPARILIWENLTPSELAWLVFHTCILASPTIPLLLWPQTPR